MKKLFALLLALTMTFHGADADHPDPGENGRDRPGVDRAGDHGTGSPRPDGGTGNHRPGDNGSLCT